MVSQKLLKILRCPNCVRNGPEAGLLDRHGNWLVCRDCERKYPIRDDIPVMLIDEGGRFQDIPVDELPEVPPPEEKPAILEGSSLPASEEDRRKLLLAVIGAALGAGLIVLLVILLTRKKDE